MKKTRLGLILDEGASDVINPLSPIQNYIKSCAEIVSRLRYLYIFMNHVELINIIKNDLTIKSYKIVSKLSRSEITRSILLSGIEATSSPYFRSGEFVRPSASDPKRKLIRIDIPVYKLLSDNILVEPAGGLRNYIIRTDSLNKSYISKIWLADIGASISRDPKDKDFRLLSNSGKPIDISGDPKFYDDISSQGYSFRDYLDFYRRAKNYPLVNTYRLDTVISFPYINVKFGSNNILDNQELTKPKTISQEYIKEVIKKMPITDNISPVDIDELADLTFVLLQDKNNYVNREFKPYEISYLNLVSRCTSDVSKFISNLNLKLLTLIRSVPTPPGRDELGRVNMKDVINYKNLQLKNSKKYLDGIIDDNDFELIKRNIHDIVSKSL
jgi:hypothetical protein